MPPGASARHTRWSTAPERHAGSPPLRRGASFSTPRVPRWSRSASNAAVPALGCSTSAGAATTGRCTAALTARRWPATPRSATPSGSTSPTRTCVKASASGSATVAPAYGIMVPKKLPRARVCPSTRPAHRWTVTAIATKETLMQIRRVSSVHRGQRSPSGHRGRRSPSPSVRCTRQVPSGHRGRRSPSPSVPCRQRARQCAAHSAAGAPSSCGSVRCAGGGHRGGRFEAGPRSRGGGR